MEEQTQQTETAQKPQGETPEPQGTDWKAEARKWEKYAKENKAKAEENAEKAAHLDEIEEANKSELQKLQETNGKLEQELGSLKAKQAHTELVNLVSTETGIPATLLHGTTEEELRQSAQALTSYIESKKPNYPTDKGGATTKSQMSKEQILAIKDPAKRRQAIYNNLDTFTKE